MIIFKKTKIGESISQVGGPFIEMIHASVSYSKENDRLLLPSTGLNVPSKKHQEHVH